MNMSISKIIYTKPDKRTTKNYNDARIVRIDINENDITLVAALFPILH
ncbi:MAG: hypothetical protein ACOX2A_12290 [Tepidanaerobacteraceae bacterium]|jgi:hypothetical protein